LENKNEDSSLCKLVFRVEAFQLKCLKSKKLDGKIFGYVKQFIDSESAIVLLDLSLKYGSDDLIQSCFDYIKHNTKEVLASESLPYVSKNTLYRFFDSEYLAAEEIEIFRAVLRWGLAEIENNQFDSTDNDEDLISEHSDTELNDHDDVEEEINLNEEFNSNKEETKQMECKEEQLNDEKVNQICKREKFLNLIDINAPPNDQELFDRKNRAIDKKKQIEREYRKILNNDTNGSSLINKSGIENQNNDSDDSDDDQSSIHILQNPLRDDVSLSTRYQLDPFPQNRHHTDLIQLSNRLGDYDKETLRNIVQDLIPFVRFPLMTPHQLTDVVEPFHVVPDHLLLEAYRYVCAPDRGYHIDSKRIQKRKEYKNRSRKSAERFIGLRQREFVGRNSKNKIATSYVT
jgi:hypothetical protein